MREATDEAAESLGDVAPATEKATEAARAATIAAQTIATATQASATAAYELADAEKTVAVATSQVARGLQEAAPYLTRAEQEFEDMVRASVEATQAQKAMAAALGQTATAARGAHTSVAQAGAGVASYQQNIQAFGYAMNDFFSVQGDLSQRLNAISNNLPMIAAGFGGIGLALGAVLPIVGVLIKNWDQLNGMMSGNTFKVPEAADQLVRLTEQLKVVTKQIDDLKDKQNLTNWELEQYNKLSGEQIILEEKKNAALERRKALDSLAGLRPEEEAKRAAGFKKAVGESGGGEGVESALRQALLNIGQATGQDFTLEGIARQAEDLMIEASKGSKEAINTITKAMRQGLPENQQKIADEIRARTPEAEAEKKQAEDVQKEREKKDREEFNDTIEMLNEAGKANEKEMERAEKEQAEIANNLAESRAEMERQREKFKADLARQNEQADKAIDKFQRDRANPEKAIQQQFAQQFQQATGADEATANEVAKRSLDLQQRGVDAMNATQQAVAEIQAAQGGLIQQYQMLQQRAAMLIGQAKQQAGRNGQADAMMPPTFFGWPN